MIRVLIVEDDPMVAELNRRYLENVPGFNASGNVRSGQEALQFLAQNEEIELVLLDIFMPGMNGLDFLTALRAQGRRVDVILVTAADDQDSIEKALRNGAVDYMIKPFEYSRFQAALEAYKKRRLLMRSAETFDQRQIDEYVLQRRGYACDLLLPKGLDRNTLRRTWECVALSEAEFTVESMAALVGISLGSMRKYLKYLQSLELVAAQLGYGAVGRPVYRYRRIAQGTDLGF